MPAKVAVNTEQIVISDGSSFLVTARDGPIDDNRKDSLSAIPA